MGELNEIVFFSEFKFNTFWRLNSVSLVPSSLRSGLTAGKTSALPWGSKHSTCSFIIYILNCKVSWCWRVNVHFCCVCLYKCISKDKIYILKCGMKLKTTKSYIYVSWFWYNKEIPLAKGGRKYKNKYGQQTKESSTEGIPAAHLHIILNNRK